MQSILNAPLTKPGFSETDAQKLSDALNAQTGVARKVVLSGFEVFSAVSAYLCYLCVKYSRDYSYAEITKIRRGHREESESCKKHTFRGIGQQSDTEYARDQVKLVMVKKTG